jgi:hypothetical protein
METKCECGANTSCKCGPDKSIEDILKGLELVNPVHLRMVSNGHGEFPDGYKLTEQGVKYILEKIGNK